MFALSDSEPTSAGFVSRVDPSFGDVWDAGLALGKTSNAKGYISRVFENFVASDSPFASLVRQELDRPPVTMATKEDLNKKYSLPGLTFERDMPEEMAQLQQERHKQVLKYQYLTSELPTLFGSIPAPGTGFSKSLVAFGANIAGSISNPLDLVLNFAPIVGQAGKVETIFGRGLIPAARLPFVAKFPVAVPIIANNLAAQTIIEIPRAVGDVQETGSPNWKGIAGDIVIGGAIAEGLRQTAGLLARLSRDSYNAALRKALSDAELGRPIDVSANIHQDPNVVRGDVEATLRNKTEAEIRETPGFQEKVKAKVDEILKDRAFLEKRLEIVKKSEMLSDEAAQSLVRQQVELEFGNIYAAAEASIRVMGHLGNVTRGGVRLLADDFMRVVEKMPEETRVQFGERYARVGLILKEIDDKAGLISDATALKLAKELGVNYDWRTFGGGHLDPYGKPVDIKAQLFSAARYSIKEGKQDIIGYKALDEAMRVALVRDVVAREELISGLAQLEMDKRIQAHARNLAEQYAKAAQDQKLGLERQLGSPDRNTWLAEDMVMNELRGSAPKEDLRFNDPKVQKTLDKSADVLPEDAASEAAMANDALKELESLGDLTEAEKAYIEALPDNESDDFVKSVVDAATGCLLGKAPSGK